MLCCFCFQQNTNEANAACMQQVLEEHSREDDSRKRKRGEVEHNPDLSEAAGMSLTFSLVCHGLSFCHVIETVPLFFVQLLNQFHL